MSPRLIRTSAFVSAFVLSLLTTNSRAQELPLSGTTGYDLFYATTPAGSSRLYAVNVFRSLAPLGVGGSINAVPSRWVHRRRTLGALETEIANDSRLVFVTPMGNAAGNGALHFVDFRAGLQTSLVPTGNPACYDVALVRNRQFVFSAEDDGAGSTLVRGFSYSAVGTLTPLTPPTVTIPGSPSAYVNRMGLDATAGQLHVPTSTGVQVLFLSSSSPHIVAGPFVSTLPAAPTTNPVQFNRNGVATWIVGTSTFNPFPNENEPVAAGFFAWTAGGASNSNIFGTVPTAPAKQWVPAVGAEELAISSNGTDTYAYYLLREPPPGTFFIKPSAVGVVRFLGSSAPVTSRILMTNDVGEPFSIPSTFGHRIAFESSFGPPFNNDPAGGGEVIPIIYSPLDPLGVGTLDGLLAVPDPLGGRISTKGMDRPIWSRDGTRVMAATSHFPGAPNPGIPGLEVLDVPADQPVSPFVGPHTNTPNLPFPNQSIILPSAFRPRNPAAATSLAGFSFFGNVFHQGLASLAAPSYGEIGQLDVDPSGFTQSIAIPDFPAIFPATFHDAAGPAVPIPGNFGARRTAFNFAPPQGFGGVTMAAAIDDRIVVQMTGLNLLAFFGVGSAQPPASVALPAGAITTTEFLSL